MSVIKFEITEDHLKLIKHLEWSVKDEIIQSLKVDANTDFDEMDSKSPFGGDNLIEDMSLILHGKTIDTSNPYNRKLFEINSDEYENMIKIFNELPTVLSICLYLQKFEVGVYKTKYHLKDWKKV